MISDEDKKVFIATLRLGHGLSYAAKYIGVSPKEISEFIKKDQNFLKECQEQIKNGSKFLIQMSLEYQQAKHADKFLRVNEELKNYINQLTFWEEYCQKKDVTEEIVCTATVHYKNMADCATAIGFTEREFIDFVCKHKRLGLYLKENKLYKF